MENTYTFTSREMELLTFAIYNALFSSQESYSFNVRYNDMELAEIALKDLNDFKALYKRFFPNLSDSELFDELFVDGLPNNQGGESK